MRDERARVRPAVLADADALMRLRVSNAEAHLALGPHVYRIPERAAVARHFTTVLTEGATRQAVLVAEAAGRWAWWRCSATRGLSLGRRTAG